MKWYVLLLLVAIDIVYIVIGGVIFHFLESENEHATVQIHYNFTRNFAASHQCITNDELQQLIKAVLETGCNGFGIMNLNATPTTNWDMYSSIFFASVVVTTIGYGNIAPKTYGGRVFCIMYALIGIPFQLIILTDIGLKQKDLAVRLTKHVAKRVATRGFSKHRLLVAVVRVLIMIVLGLSLFLLIPAAIFQAIEGWSYGESFYYGFITLTTIGFGDYVASANSDISYRGWYRLCVACWILLGISWLSGVISATQNLFSSFTVSIDNKLAKHNSAPTEDEPEITMSQVQLEANQKETLPTTERE